MAETFIYCKQRSYVFTKAQINEMLEATGRQHQNISVLQYQSLAEEVLKELAAAISRGTTADTTEFVVDWPRTTDELAGIAKAAVSIIERWKKKDTKYLDLLRNA